MRIGVVGAGAIGGGLARLLARAGHDVVLSGSGDPGVLARRAAELGARAVSSAEASAYGEVVVLSVPWVRVDDALAGLGGAGALAGRVVIDTTNQFGPLDGGGYGVQPLAPDSASRTNARKAPGARWAKAFNTLTAGFQQDAAGRADPVALFYATDTDTDAPLLEQLVRDAGFGPVRTGTLAREDVGHQEPKGDLYGEEFGVAQGRDLVARLRGTPPSGRGRP